ncbi:MAG: ParB/RepB/Spo0J family partition protein [Selenomonadaceae bacterium]|nr:ParB/RepB/Spo0J family partition protein [Selenomonadaceae bacterium]
MANKAHGGLGKGLGAFFQNPKTESAPSRDKVQEIAVSMIQANRYQPRKDFDEGALEELKESIKSYGVLQPILVRKLPGEGYELIAGERRLRAAKLAGIQKVPALVKEYNDIEISEIALIENIQRKDLNVIEEAHAYERLMKEFHLTQESMAGKLGRSRSHIANILRLLKLAPKVQDYVSQGTLSMGQAKPLLSLENEELQCATADMILEQSLSARQAEALVKKLQSEQKLAPQEEKPAPMNDQAVYVKDAEEKLRQFLGTQVKILNGKKKNRIEIEFYSEEDLERIIQNLIQAKEDVKQQKIDALRKISRSQNFTV